MDEYKYYLKEYVGRPSTLDFAENMTEDLGGAKIYLKREDLNHTGAHKINNAIGQVLLAKRMGKKKIVAETGAGQHGVATATVAAKFKMECKIFMGEEDITSGISSAETDNPQDKKDVTFGHENKNIDSGRFKLWKESINLFKISPFIKSSSEMFIF